MKYWNDQKYRRVGAAQDFLLEAFIVGRLQPGVTALSFRAPGYESPSYKINVATRTWNIIHGDRDTVQSITSGN